ncbi:MAG: hypothetical protein N2485_08305 [bacterium]|nr:hypothetical protein [bacterium]
MVLFYFKKGLFEKLASNISTEYLYSRLKDIKNSKSNKQLKRKLNNLINLVKRELPPSDFSGFLKKHKPKILFGVIGGLGSLGYYLHNKKKNKGKFVTPKIDGDFTLY